MSRFCKLTSCLFVLLTLSQNLWGQADVPKEATAVPGDGQLVRLDNKVYRAGVAADQFPVKVPKFYAPVRRAVWSQGSDIVSLDLSPELTYWTLSTKQVLSGQGTLMIEFDSPALLSNEVLPTASGADGSIWLPAHLAATHGEKLRYEPQPFKNTVGYWTQASDFAVWKFRVDKAGKFNLAVLQGCGVGQGGSRAVIDLQDATGKNVGQVEFDVLETGHFQNFQWIQVGTVELKEAGEFQLKVSPKQIRKNALMDIRMIHLIRLPG